MKFSIVTPCLEQLSFLDECIASIATQKRPLNDDQSVQGHLNFQIEHIVQDGGSKKWAAFVEGYAGGMKQAEGSDYSLHLYSESDQGQTDAINKGLAKSSGEILAYLCADDYYEARVFQKVAHIFEKYPEVDVVYGDGYFIEGDSGWKRLKKTGAFSVDRLRELNFIIQPATFWRRRVYDQFGPMDASLQYCMDNEYWLRICEGTVWHYLPEPLASATLHQEAKTSSQLVKAWEETAEMVERYGLGERYHQYAKRMRWYGARWYGWKRWVLCRMGRVIPTP